MSKHPDLNGTALALLRALDRGEVRGIRVLSERAAGRPLCGAADLDVMRSDLRGVATAIALSRAGNGWRITDAKGGTSMITIADVNQSNGVIHVIDTVLMP